MLEVKDKNLSAVKCINCNIRKEKELRHWKPNGEDTSTKFWKIPRKVTMQYADY